MCWGGGFCQTIYHIEGYVVRHGCAPQMLDTLFYTNSKLKNAILAFKDGSLQLSDRRRKADRSRKAEMQGPAKQVRGWGCGFDSSGACRSGQRVDPQWGWVG